MLRRRTAVEGLGFGVWKIFILEFVQLDSPSSCMACFVVLASPFYAPGTVASLVVLPAFLGPFRGGAVVSPNEC